MNWAITTYSIYLLGSLFLTVWVGHSLYRNGRPYVEMVFRDIQIAASINKLLLIGFYLINAAYALLVLTENRQIISLEEMLEVLSLKLGFIVVLLAGMHFFNLFALLIMKRRKLFIT